MDVRVLRYFLAVSQTENITHAAAQLHISQPTLSRQLTELEQELGKPLLVRGSKSTTLTADGSYLKDRAEEIVSLVDRTVRAFHNDGDAIDPEFRVGIGEDFFVPPTVRALKRLGETLPQIETHLETSDEETALRRLTDGLLDAVIVTREPDDNSLEALPIETDVLWGIVCREDDAIVRLSEPTRDDLAGPPIFCPDRVGRALFAERFPSVGIDPCDHLFYTFALIREGLARAFVSSGVGRSLPPGLVFLPLEPSLPVTLYVVRKKRRVPLLAANTFFNALLDESRRPSFP